MFWPILILAASAILKMKENQRSIDRQESLANAMRDYQATRAKSNEATINKLVSENSPSARGTDLSTVAQQKAAEMNKDVAAVQPAQPQNASIPQSPEAKNYGERAAQTVSDRTKRAIEQMSVMQSPGQVRQNYGIRFGRAAGDVAANTDAINSVGNAYQRDIANVKNNPYVDLLSQIGMSYGMGSLMSGAGAGTTGGGPAQPNLISPNNGTEWGSLDAGPGAYNAGYRPRVNTAFSIWGR